MLKVEVGSKRRAQEYLAPLPEESDGSNMDRTKVLIVDDNIRFRWALMEALVQEESLEIMDEASDGNEAVEKARDLKPHVVLMDLYMPNRDGVEATRQLQAEMPDTNVLMLTVSEAEADLVSALKAGARGYLLKNESPEQVVQAIHYVARGGLLVSPSMATKLLGELKTQEPPAEGAAVTQVKPPAKAEAPTPEEEREVTEQVPEQPPMDTREPPEEEPEPLVPISVADPEDLVSEVHLMLSPPLEPTTVLRLHRWLKEVAKGDVGKITASWGGETAISVEFREPVPLLQMLAESPDIAEVVEEPYAGEEAMPADAAASPAERKVGFQRLAPRQFRVTLKAE